ncbi:hypothetical protein [Endozoicomonas atrinae]|uniref:hypothetical protein n=1 Tax=Endozoicomonas atrinae TaxID=1333660 RepID=UPI000826A38F|nr:hypothetical protein [Endozoicomonas atrinae]
MTGLEVFTLIKDVALTGAAISGAVVAIKGLGTWRRQLKGQSEYELSRRILVSLFKYRDAINGVRHPAMFSYEIPHPSEDEAKSMSPDDIRYYGISKAYQNRWEKVQEQRTSLYADQLEAEAIWGNELNTLFKSIYSLEHELFNRVRHHLVLMDPSADEGQKDAILNIDKKKRDIMYDELGEEPDEFKQELLEAIALVENYLKPNLRHEVV